MPLAVEGALALLSLDAAQLDLATARSLHTALLELSSPSGVGGPADGMGGPARGVGGPADGVGGSADGDGGLARGVGGLARGVGAVLLTGDGPNFCVGGDLREFAAAEDVPAHVRAVATEVHAALRILTELPVPVVTAVRGAVAGGGVGLALAGDIVVAGRGARFRLAYTAAGLSPDCGGSWVLPRLVGMPRAMHLALANPVVTAEAAERMGLVSLVVDDAELESASRALALRLADGPRQAQAATKRLLRSALDSSYGSHLDREADSIAHLAGTPEAREGIQAFLSKRRPHFPSTASI